MKAMYLLLFVAVFLTGCATTGTPKLPESKNDDTLFFAGITAYEKAVGCIEIDSLKAMEHYSEAKVSFQNFTRLAGNNPTATERIQEANYYLKRIECGRDFVNGKEIFPGRWRIW